MFISMTKKSKLCILFVISLIEVVPVVAFAHKNTEGSYVRDQICTIYNSDSFEDRGRAAKNIAEAVAGQGLSGIRLRQIVELLKKPGDGSLIYLSVVVGDSGPKAKFAIPILNNVYAKISCEVGDFTPAPSVKSAIIKLGGSVVQTERCANSGDQIYSSNNGGYSSSQYRGVGVIDDRIFNECRLATWKEK